MIANTVLVIEDNEMNADVLRENLTDAGYRFTLAVNGAAGVAAANEFLPDIILMDVNLPILDGLSATRLLKRNSSTQGIPVVALTARAMSGDRDVCLAAGCDDYVSKPVDIDLLLAKMQHHLSLRPPAFVEMIHRQRAEAPNRGLDGGTRPGMAPKDYEEEFAALNHTLERMEAALQLAQMRVDELDETLSEREQQIAVAIAERDEALDGARKASELTRRVEDALHQATSERDLLRMQGAANGPGPDTVAVLADELQQAQERVRALELEIDAGSGNELRTLRAQNESLRKAFLQLHKAVVRSADEAMHQVAFG